MELLNIVFGIVTVTSLLYAVWQNRKAVGTRQLAERITTDIQSLAGDIVEHSRGTPIEGYAKSIERVSRSLLSVSPANRVDVHFSCEYFAPQMHTNIGKLVEDPDVHWKFALEGSVDQPAVLEGEVPPRSALVFGPYKRLPMAGKYRASYRLRSNNPIQPHDGVLHALRLDVFYLQQGLFLGERYLSRMELTEGWQWFDLEFEYPDPKWPLEYRVILMEPGLTIRFELVRVSFGQWEPR